MTGAQLERSRVREDDLCIEAVAETNRLIDSAGFAEARERLIEAICGHERDRQGVIQIRGLAVIAARQRLTRPNRLAVRGDRRGKIARCALESGANGQPLEPLLGVLASLPRPERLCPIEQGASAADAAAQQLDIGQLLPRVSQRHGVRSGSKVLEKPLEQSAGSVDILQRSIEVCQ